MLAQYLEDAHSVVRAVDLNGKLLYDVKLPGLGQAVGFSGDVDRSARRSSPTPIF